MKPFFNDTATTEIYTRVIFPYTTLFRSNVITVLYQQGRAFYAFFYCVKRLIFEHLQIVFVICRFFSQLAHKPFSSCVCGQ